MRKIAARTYRDSKGNKITAEELIRILGGGTEKHNVPRQAYVDLRSNKGGAMPWRVSPAKLFKTGDGKYNYFQTSSKRYELGREDISGLGNNAIRQNKVWENRTSNPVHILGTRGYDSQSYSSGYHSIDKDGKFSRVKNQLTDKAKNYINNDKKIIDNQRENLRGIYKKYKQKIERDASGAIPAVLIGTGALTAAGLGAHSIYSKIKNKMENDKKNNREKTAYAILDEMYMSKVAQVDVEDAADSIPNGVQSDADMMTKIVEAVKYSKPQQTPGGKTAPSKLVWRKNKERFMG